MWPPRAPTARCSCRRSTPLWPAASRRSARWRPCWSSSPSSSWRRSPAATDQPQGRNRAQGGGPAGCANRSVMSELTTKRTLVKSPPELWAEVSDLEALAKHLGEFGEIKITRLEPETTVVWEGDRICGTVRLEPSGWGTKVTLTAELAELEAAAEPVVEEPEPVIEEEVVEEPVAVEPPPPAPSQETPDPQPAPELSAPEPKQGFWARLFGRKKMPVAETPPPVEEPD